jgi:hypothetical protein
LIFFTFLQRELIGLKPEFTLHKWKTPQRYNVQIEGRAAFGASRSNAVLGVYVALPPVLG